MFSNIWSRFESQNGTNFTTRVFKLGVKNKGATLATLRKTDVECLKLWLMGIIIE